MIRSRSSSGRCAIQLTDCANVEHARSVLRLLVLDARFLQAAERPAPDDLRQRRPGLNGSSEDACSVRRYAR